MVASVEEDGRVGHRRPISVVVIGMRGIVQVGGGIETHARRLYPLLVRLGCRVEVLQRAAYYPVRRPAVWHGVDLKYLWSPRARGVETAVHSLLGVFYAALRRPDIVHLHAVGPAFLAPLARFLGLRVVVTHHAADYRREKWGRLARLLLETGERLGMRCAHGPIAVSETLQESVQRRYGVRPTLIPNGAPRAMRLETRAVLEELGLEVGRYVLCVARIDQVKRQLDLVEAFERAGLAGWKLVLVGALDERDDYARRVVARGACNPDVILPGYRQGRALRELYSHCGVFVLPSSLEGQPIALLEALSYGAAVLASDIPENRALPIGAGSFFRVGDHAALASALKGAEAAPRARADVTHILRETYSWRRAAHMTRSVYDRVLSSSG